MLAILAKAALIAAFVFVIAVIGLATWKGSSLIGNSQQQQQIPEQGKAHEENTKNTNDSIFKKFFAGIFWVIQLLDRHNGLVSAIGTLFVALFTAVLVIATAALFYSSENVADAAKTSAKAAKDAATAATASNEFNKRVFEATQRPWVSISNFEIISAFRFDQSGQMRARLTLQNSGHLPAANVQVLPKAYFPGAGGGNPAHEREDFLNEIKARVMRYDMLAGQVVFPGANVPTEVQLGIDPKLIAEMIERKQSDNLFVIICLDYRFMGEEGRHQTSTIFMVQKVKPNGNGDIISPADGDIPVEGLRVVWHPMGTIAN